MKERIADKIKNYLVTKEGFTVLASEQTSTYDTVKIADSFGFVYEVKLVVTGRIQQFDVKKEA